MKPRSHTPVLLLHGFTGSADAWGVTIREGLARASELIAVDLPGHERRPSSPEAHRPERYRIERVVEDLVGVLDSRGITRADWIGYSMGGRIALAAAVLRPERVRRLVLESASPGLESEEARASRRRSDAALARTLEARGIGWFTDHWMALPMFRTQRRLPDEVLAAARARRMGHDAAALAAALRGIGTGSQPSFWDALPEVQASTLLLTGALDEKYVELASRMLPRFADARHRNLDGVGHAVHLEAPERWLDAVVRFLSGPPP